MAELNGVRLKAIKRIVGCDRYCSQGKISIDGKAIGTWSQDIWGGADKYDIDEAGWQLLTDRVSSYYRKHPVVDESVLMQLNAEEVNFNNLPMTDYSNTDSVIDYFMSNLLRLIDLDKQYRKYTKEHNEKVMGILDFYKGNWVIPKFKGYTLFRDTKEEIYKDLEDILEEVPYAYITCFSDVGDFVIY